LREIRPRVAVVGMTSLRTTDMWSMYGAKHDRGWWVVDDYRTVKMHGVKDPLPVTVREDSAGEYMGWIEKDTDQPIMIQYHQFFDIQFPYGHKKAEEHGNGKAVRLTVTEE
jgi:hypothetical protein